MIQIQISNCFTDGTVRAAFKKGRYAVHDHMHKNNEIMFVKDGEIDVTVGGKRERAKAGDVIIIPPFAVHSYHTEKFSDIWLCVFSNDYISGFADKDDSYFYGERAVFTPSECLLGFFTPKLFDSNEKIFFPTSAEARKIKAVLYAVFEEYMSSVPQTGMPKKSNALSLVLAYLHDNYKRDITLNDLAKSLGYNPAYLSHALTELGGIKFRTLLNSFRVEKAMELLKNKKYKMIDIAMECGFSCERSFYRAFMAITGSTPRAYKEEPLDSDFADASDSATFPYRGIHVPGATLSRTDEGAN